MVSTVRLRPEVLAAREKLADGRRRLRLQHDSGSPGIQVCNYLTELVDNVLLELYRAALSESEPGLESLVTLVPHGGYGRRDLAPFSDVDLMFLHPAEAEQKVLAFVQRLYRDIVDAGLTLGSSFRTPEYACSAALKDATIFTSLCEARFLGGDNALFARFHDLFRHRAQRRTAALIEQIELARREERQQFGETTYLLQPNVKRSRGGLRDLQLLRWVGFARYGESDPENLVRAGVLAREDRRQLVAAHEFLLRLRNEIHFHAGSSLDLLDKAEQLRLAALFKYEGNGTLIPVERFMRDYIEHTNAVSYIVSHFVNTAKQRHSLNQAIARLFSHQVDGDFRITPREIQATRQGMKKVRGDLEQVLRLMDVANRYDVWIDHSTWCAIRESMCNRTDIVVTPEAAKRFLSLMSLPGRLGNLLRRLHEMRVLERIVVPMAHARGLVQFNEYHKYTVDEHSIRAVDAATEFAKDPSTLGEVYRSLRDKRLLHLAILVHDLGKGFPEDHCLVGKRLAAEIAGDLRLSRHEAETLCYLVEKHLLMSHLAQRRDIHDPDVVVQFAVDVGSLEVLQMLYVLTCADLMAVGPGVLNDWKRELLTQLYLHARDCLAGDGTSPRLDEQLAQKRNQVLSFAGAEAKDPWWIDQVAGLPRGYLLQTPPQQLAAELLKMRTLPRDQAVAWGRWLPDRNALEYTVGAYDEITPGIFHKLTGVLTSKRMQILSAAIHTLAGNMVLDRFHVCDLDFTGEPPRERLAEIEAALVSSLQDKTDRQPVFSRVWRPGTVNPAPAETHLPTQVRVDNSSSDRFTIIDVFAHDRLGLLYAITRTIFELGLSVHVAKIGTHLDQVVDVFYVTDQANGKLRDEARLAALGEKLQRAIDG
jgi:[protein-PII] uridylyltransferase